MCSRPVKIVSKPKKEKKRKHTSACDHTVVVCSMLLLVDANQGDGDRHCQWRWSGSGGIVGKHLTTVGVG